MFFRGAIAQQNTLPTTGKVGIGTSTPAEALEVSGNVRIDSCLMVKDSAIEHTDVIKSIHISDIYGKTLFNKIYFDTGNALNFSLDLKSGVYFITANNSVQIKFIVL